jgi:hypothetical protein
LGLDVEPTRLTISLSVIVARLSVKVRSKLSLEVRSLRSLSLQKAKVQQKVNSQKFGCSKKFSEASTTIVVLGGGLSTSQAPRQRIEELAEPPT